VVCRGEPQPRRLRRNINGDNKNRLFWQAQAIASVERCIVSVATLGPASNPYRDFAILE
jgi:hypothetical protein